MNHRFSALAATLTSALVAAAQPSWTPALAAMPQAAPEARLADTGLFGDGVRAFSPQYPLWSDGLAKKRWIFLPAETAIDGRRPDAWEFPVGTRLWKEFSLGGRKVETRMLWKASEAGWISATYIWNTAGTDARLAPPEGVPAAAEFGRGRVHNVPGRTDCAACHGTSRLVPLGFNALQLSTDRDPNAIHGEPLPEGALDLRALVQEGRLAGAGAELLAHPPRIQTADPETRAVLGYFSANCAHCHNGQGEIAALGPTFRYRDLLGGGDAVAAQLMGYRTKWQQPGVADGASVLVTPGAPDRSALLYRMRSRAPSSQMPPLGTVLRDEDAVAMVTRWIERQP